jgi:DNA polymerase V
LKVKKLLEIRTNYSFEAPVFNAISPLEKTTLREEGQLPSLDLNSFLAPNPDSIYLVKVNGESMIDEGIFSGDILIIDRHEKPRNGKIVIAALNGEMAVKTLRIIDGNVYLFSANKKFLPIGIEEYMQFEVQGVVKHVIHSV